MCAAPGTTLSCFTAVCCFHRELRKTSHCAVYLETTEKHHRRGSIPVHAFKIRHFTGVPCRVLLIGARRKPHCPSVAGGRLVQPGEAWREVEPASTQDALSSRWLPPDLLTSCTVPGSHPTISPQFKVQAISLILLPRDSLGPTDFLAVLCLGSLLPHLDNFLGMCSEVSIWLHS